MSNLNDSIIRLDKYLEEINRLLNDSTLYPEDQEELVARAVAGFELLPAIQFFYLAVTSDSSETKKGLKTYRQLKKEHTYADRINTRAD